MVHTRTSGTIGVVLAALLAGWSFLAHPAAPAAPAMAGMVLAGIAAWVGGGWLARSYREAPGVAVVALVTVAMLAGGTESLSGGATAPPLGYANASAALLTIGVAGALSAAAHARDRLRTGLVVWAGVLAVASLATGSRAVAACCVLLMLLWPRLRRGPAAAWQAFAATVVGAAVVATVLLGATGSSSAEAGVVPETVGSTRVDLWSEALDITADHPVRGVGPGNFSLHSPTAGSDPDLQWAHSTPMQVLAELGLVGLALLAALTGWMVLALGRGAVFLAILALQPTVDYVLTFPAVLLGAAFVLGSVAATGVGRPGYLPVQRVSSSP